MDATQQDDVRRLAKAAAELEAKLAQWLPMMQDHPQYQVVLAQLRSERSNLERMRKRARNTCGF